MNDIILQTHNLSKIFKARCAVADLNLEVYRGDVFGFLGPNGAGKSTTIRMMLTLIYPTSGYVSYFGKPLNKYRKEILSRIGGLVEKPDFYGHLSAFDNLKFIGSLYGGVKASRIEEVLEIVKLNERMNDKVKTFSHGMKQRLGIAQALLNNPEIIILDEPTTGLDPQGMKEIRELIRNLSQLQNITIFLSSHLLREVELIATRMAIINLGKLVVQGNIKELLQGSEQYIQIQVEPHEQAVKILSKLPFIKKIIPQNNIINVYTSPENYSIVNETLVKSDIQVSSLIPHYSLEDYFIEITEQSNSVGLSYV